MAAAPGVERLVMQNVVEILRLPSPAPRPQSLAFDGSLLWMGSRETRRIYALDPKTWAVRDEAAAPGTPWGMTVVGDELRVLCGETDDDHRIIRRFVPAHGFKSHEAVPCPDDTGSQLSYDGDRLYVSQWYNKRILSLDESGNVGSTIDVRHEIVGQTIVKGRFFTITTDLENSNEYFLTRVDARGEKPIVEKIARVGFPARALAFDGERFWTNHREADRIVAFKVDGTYLN